MNIQPSSPEADTNNDQFRGLQVAFKEAIHWLGLREANSENVAKLLSTPQWNGYSHQ